MCNPYLLKLKLKITFPITVFHFNETHLEGVGMGESSRDKGDIRTHPTLLNVSLLDALQTQT
jgi:hypothetical protein